MHLLVTWQIQCYIMITSSLHQPECLSPASLRFRLRLTGITLAREKLTCIWKAGICCLTCQRMSRLCNIYYSIGTCHRNGGILHTDLGKRGLGRVRSSWSRWPHNLTPFKLAWPPWIQANRGRRMRRLRHVWLQLASPGISARPAAFRCCTYT